MNGARNTLLPISGISPPDTKHSCRILKPPARMAFPCHCNVILTSLAGTGQIWQPGAGYSARHYERLSIQGRAAATDHVTFYKSPNVGAALDDGQAGFARPVDLCRAGTAACLRQNGKAFRPNVTRSRCRRHATPIRTTDRFKANLQRANQVISTQRFGNMPRRCFSFCVAKRARRKRPIWYRRCSQGLQAAPSGTASSTPAAFSAASPRTC